MGMSIDIKKLKGVDLLYYLTSTENPDNGLSELASLLFLYNPDKEESLKVLEDIIKQDKKLIAIYPGLGEEPTKDMELICSIPDGALYAK